MKSYSKFQLAKDCKYLSTTAKFEIGMETFTVTGHSLIDPGYTSLLTWQALSNNESLPRFSIGERVKIQEVSFHSVNKKKTSSFCVTNYSTALIFQSKQLECFTQPPDYLTESELITLMEKHGIGTDASIPVHINNICIRNYVNVATGRKLVPTSLGIVLVHGYQKVSELLALLFSNRFSACLRAFYDSSENYYRSTRSLFCQRCAQRWRNNWTW